MIKTGNFIVIASLAIIFLLSVCEDETRKYELNTDFTGKLISHSECKGNKSVSEKSGNKDFSSINYKYFPLSGILRINHVNAGFNCCPDSIYCTINQNSDTICVFEYDTEAGCHCNCLLDLDIEIDGIKPQTYYLKFIEPYVGDQAKLEFSIDLAESDIETYTVNRNQYPWGE